MPKAAAVSVEHKKYIEMVYRRRFWIHFTQISLLFGVIFLWELAARIHWIDPFITSSPSGVIKTMIELTYNGSLFVHIGITVYETMIGFLLGTFLGILIAILLWWSDFFRRVLDPYWVVLNSLPKTALGPIIIVWIGANTTAIIVIALLISVIVTIMTILTGFSEVDSDKIKLIKSFGGKKIDVLTKVILPSSIPTMMNALKVSVGLSWVGVIVGEFLVIRKGLGYLIVYGGQIFRLDWVMASVIILAICAYIMYVIVSWIEKRFLHNRT